MDALAITFGAFCLIVLIHTIFGSSAFTMIIIFAIAIMGCGYFLWEVFFNTGYYYEDGKRKMKKRRK